MVPLLLALAVFSLLPLVESNRWWIRFLDFPRIQVTIALLLVLALYVILGGWRGRFGLATIVLSIIALSYQAYRLYPYTPLVEPMALRITTCPADARLAVMVANVKRTNRRADALLRIIEQAEPDLLLVLETDEWWDRQLAPLDKRFGFNAQHIPTDAEYYGMHLFSRYPLIDAQVKFLFGADTPTIFSGVRLPKGEVIQFVGLHPRPPQSWSRPTTMRDGHLATAALAAADSDAASVIAGDFNSVPWERITRRVMRLGQLLDPRVGRGTYPTYDAQSWILSWPLDQVLYQARFGLLGYDTLPEFGSDHYPILAELCYSPAMADRQSAPAHEEGDREEARTAIEAARQLER
nr:endonuclease/exonuclease/phosphatase family protein [Aurantimonas marianensis]